MGAGVATAVSQYLSLIAGLMFVASPNWWPLVPGVLGKVLQLEALKTVMKLNRNCFAITSTYTSTYVIFMNMSAAFDTVILVSNNLMFQVVNISIALIEGFALATQVMVGSYYGAGRHQKLVSVLKFYLLIALSLGISYAMMFVLFPDTLFGLLTNNTEAIAMIHRLVFWLLPLIGFMSLTYILDAYFLGLTKSLIVLKGKVRSMVFGFVPVAIIAWQLDSSHLLWLAFLLFIVLRALLLAAKCGSFLAGTPRNWGCMARVQPL